MTCRNYVCSAFFQKEFTYILKIFQNLFYLCLRSNILTASQSTDSTLGKICRRSIQITHIWCDSLSSLHDHTRHSRVVFFLCCCILYKRSAIGASPDHPFCTPWTSSPFYMDGDWYLCLPYGVDARRPYLIQVRNWWIQRLEPGAYGAVFLDHRFNGPRFEKST